MDKEKSNSQTTEYLDSYGNNVKLSFDLVRRFVYPGKPISEKSLLEYITTCKTLKANPYLKDIFLTPCGNDVSIIISKDYALKVAQTQKNYRGVKQQLIIYNKEKDDVKFTGGILYPNYTILGARADVMIAGLDEPIFIEVNFNEYNVPGSPSWKRIPGTMIMKVALVQALRLAMPTLLSKVYDASEMIQAGVDEAELPDNALPVKNTEASSTECEKSKVIDNLMDMVKNNNK